MVRTLPGVWANEARVYDAAVDGHGPRYRFHPRRDLPADALCAVCILVMERLLIGTSNIYKQIAGACTIFTAMTLALVWFHPAFKISASPLIIILAFAIILMSCLVIAVVYGKFDVELKRIRSGRGTAPGASFANTGVMMSAVLLGIANMRKRKFRTLLTSVTIVLITFAVLCFTSSAHYVGTTSIPTGIASSHPGIMLRQRGYRPIPAILAAQLRTVLADPAMRLGDAQVVERWWAVSVAEPKEQPISSLPIRPLRFPRCLACHPVRRLSRIAEVIGPDKFARLENGERNIVYLGLSMAESPAPPMKVIPFVWAGSIVRSPACLTRKNSITT